MVRSPFRLPFRLGTTCFVYRADLVENARRLAGKADDIELIFFDTVQWGSNFPTEQQVAELTRIGRENELTYTVHLPLDLRLGSEAGFEQAKRAIEVTRALEPLGYVMHLDGSALADGTRALEDWQGEARNILMRMSGGVREPELLCVENVEGWDAEAFAEVVEEAGVSRCVDIGHLWKEGRDPVQHLEKYFERTRVIHLHGIGIGTGDHQSVANMSDAQLLPVIEMLLKREYRGVMTLEVFSPEDFVSSREAVMRAVEKIT